MTASDRPTIAPGSPPARPATRPRLSVWLAGRVPFEDYLAAVERLAWEVSEPGGRGPTLVLCEHAGVITIGRGGSRRDVGYSDEELRARQVGLRFVGRGGGAIPHAPGQVAVALFARLADLGLGESDVGGYQRRLEEGILCGLQAMRCGPLRVDRGGVFGRTGLLAAVGIAVRRGVVCHGAYLNVSSRPDAFASVRCVAGRPMGSVEAERQRPLRLTAARSILVEKIADAFDAEVAGIQSGFPRGPSRPVLPSEHRHVG